MIVWSDTPPSGSIFPGGLVHQLRKDCRGVLDCNGRDRLSFLYEFLYGAESVWCTTLEWCLLVGFWTVVTYVALRLSLCSIFPGSPVHRLYMDFTGIPDCEDCMTCVLVCDCQNCWMMNLCTKVADG